MFGNLEKYTIKITNKSFLCFKIIEKDNDTYKIVFGIKNQYFKANITDFNLRVDELNHLIILLNTAIKFKSLEESLDFLDARIKFYFAHSTNDQWLDIEFYFMENDTDHYSLSLYMKDIINLCHLLTIQKKEKKFKVIETNNNSLEDTSDKNLIDTNTKS